MKKFVKYLFVTPASLLIVLPVASCGCSTGQDSKDVIPTDKLKIDNGVLSGFVDNFDPTQYNSLSIPTEVTKITSEAFNNKFNGDSCKLKTIIIPNSVTTIESKAFANNSAISTYDLSNFTSTDGYSWASDVFSGCGTSGTIKYPDVNTDLLDKIDYLMCDAGLALGWFDLTKEREVDNNYFNIDTAASPAVTFKGLKNEFYSTPHCQLFNKLTIPCNCTKISKGAFATVDGQEPTTKIPYITNISFALNPDTEQTSIKTIGEYAFACAQFTNDLVIPSGVTNLLEGSFYKCDKFSNLSLPDGLAEIGASCFKSCTGLKSFKASSTLDTIGDSAFEGCTQISSIDVSLLAYVPQKWSKSSTFKNIAQKGSIVCEPTISSQWLAYFQEAGIEEIAVNWTITDKVDITKSYTAKSKPYSSSEAKTPSELETIYFSRAHINNQIFIDDMYTSLHNWTVSANEDITITKFAVRLDNAIINTNSTLSFTLVYDLEGSDATNDITFKVENGTWKFSDVPLKDWSVEKDEEYNCLKISDVKFDGHLKDSEFEDSYIRIKEQLTYTMSGTPGTATINKKIDASSIDSLELTNISQVGSLLYLNWMINKEDSKYHLNLDSTYLKDAILK